MIAEIIATLHSNDFYGAGKCTEIGKGKHELITDFKGLKRKATRLWRTKK